MANTFTLYGRALTLAAMLALPASGIAQSLTAPASAASQATEFFAARRAKLGLTEADLRNPAVASQYTDAETGVTHVYLQQRHAGISIYGAVTEVHVGRSGQLVGLHNAFVPNAGAGATSTTPGLSAVQAVAAAAQALHLPAPQGLSIVQEGTPTEGITFSKAGISLEDIPVKLMYLPRPNGELTLVWDVTIYPLDGQHYWDARIDASTGKLLDRNDFVIGEEASFNALSRQYVAQQQRTLATAKQPTPTTGTTAAKPNVPNSYGVWPITIESPDHGARSVVANPANTVASPFGWHDTNGAAGAEYTITRGNNVHAYEDRRNRNAAGYAPDGGANLEFDFPTQNNVAASANQDAAITNLFYWNNLMHDVMQRHGFTESARNFQTTNYSGQGLGGDYVQAEAQDGSGLNNANFSSPAEGIRPRMQMYLWETNQRSLVGSTATTSLGPFQFTDALFGRRLAALSGVTGTLVYAGDGGCTGTIPNAAALNGNIALIKRGNCAFAIKVKNAQTAGARMVIVMDSVAGGALINMSGAAPDTNGIRIPALFISKANGDQLRSALAAGPVTMSAYAVDRDGDFDNGVVAHEYGHGISNRLTGTGSGCLSNAEQMGEGWSDFFALWMTVRPGDTGATPRMMGTYASGDPTGIRSKPYSTDFAVNNLTYANLGVAPYREVHYNGEIWCATLWDLNWALIGQHGYNNDLYATTGGNNVALRLVIEGCKYQGCSPGFISGRNGILKADSVLNGAANSALIWQVFARRGMGAGASQGSSNSITDQTVSFTLPAVLAAKTRLSADLLNVYPNPAQDRVTVRLAAAGTAPVRVELLNALGQVVQATEAPAQRLQAEGVELSTAALAAGIYVVRLTGDNGTASQKLVVRH